MQKILREDDPPKPSTRLIGLGESSVTAATNRRTDVRTLKMQLSGDLDWVSVFAAFALVQLLTSVPITPSGLGVAEAAYVAVLTAGSSTEFAGQVAAAAIIYRLFSWVLLVPLGAVAWLWWSRTRTRSSADMREAKS